MNRAPNWPAWFILGCALGLLLKLTLEAQVATGLDSAGAPLKYDPVTEAEYAAREAARPPAPPAVVPPAQNTGTTIVRTEAQLTAALPQGGRILVPGCPLVVSKRIGLVARGTVLVGNGTGNSRIVMSSDTTDDRVIYPTAPDCTVSDLTISGGAKRVAGVNMDGNSRVADRLTFNRVNIESVSWGIFLSGGPGTEESHLLEDFAFVDSRITDASQGGIFLSWELLRPRIEQFYIGRCEAYNGIWIGCGVVDGRICNGIIEKVGRIGLEVYYAHGSVGGPSPSLTSKLYPMGPGITVDNLVVSDTKSMGISLAGCKRSNIGSLTVRNSQFIGVEFVDEDPTRSDYNVSGPVSVADHQGWAISIDQIKGGRFSGIMVDKVRVMNGYQMGAQVWKSDDVILENSTFTDCGPRQILHNQTTRAHYRNNHFIAQPGETWPDAEGGNFAIYCYGGDVYFHGNTIRGNSTNPLRTAVNNCVYSSSPTAMPFPGYSQDWDDPDNYRGRQYKPVSTGRAVPPPAAAPPVPPRVPRDYRDYWAGAQ